MSNRQLSDLRRGAREAAVGNNALGWIALCCLAGSVVFWIWIQWLLVQPGNPLSCETSGCVIGSVFEIGIAVILGVLLALTIPLLCSMLAPTTPAGQLLRKTQEKTTGFQVVIAAAMFLCVYAYFNISDWWGLRPAYDGSELTRWQTSPTNVRMQAIMTCIVFIVVPALAWVQATPVQFRAQVETWLAVQRFELQLKYDLLIAKERYAWALGVMTRGLANATAEEAEEASGIFVGLFTGMNQALDDVARGIGEITKMEAAVPTLDDPSFRPMLDDLSVKLRRHRAKVNAPALPAPHDADSESHVVDVPSRPVAHVNSRSGPSEPQHDEVAPRRAAARHDTPRHATTHDGAQRDPYLEMARQGLKPVWTVKELAAAIGASETSAREIIHDWKDQGVVQEARLGRYNFTERKATQEVAQ